MAQPKSKWDRRGQPAQAPTFSATTQSNLFLRLLLSLHVLCCLFILFGQMMWWWGCLFDSTSLQTYGTRKTNLWKKPCSATVWHDICREPKPFLLSMLLEHFLFCSEQIRPGTNRKHTSRRNEWMSFKDFEFAMLWFCFSLISEQSLSTIGMSLSAMD